MGGTSRRVAFALYLWLVRKADCALMQLREAALNALAALAQDNYEVAAALCKPSVLAYGLGACCVFLRGGLK